MKCVPNTRYLHIYDTCVLYNVLHRHFIFLKTEIYWHSCSPASSIPCNNSSQVRKLRWCILIFLRIDECIKQWFIYWQNSEEIQKFTVCKRNKLNLQSLHLLIDMCLINSYNNCCTSFHLISSPRHPTPRHFTGLGGQRLPEVQHSQWDCIVHLDRWPVSMISS